MTRGKLSRTKFESSCLAEYAETFKTVCADAGYYQFPSAKMLDGYFSQVPSDFKLSIKVTEVHRKLEHRHLLNDETQAIFAGGGDPFKFPGLIEVREFRKELLEPLDAPCIIPRILHEGEEKLR